ncbi:MAG: energy transducer TonB [Candidatus Eremiobacteraeota bacterium]|nr:energy transducer TonB [Candidatus Eremiobacteraeota bacterium]
MTRRSLFVAVLAAGVLLGAARDVTPADRPPLDPDASAQVPFIAWLAPDYLKSKDQGSVELLIMIDGSGTLLAARIADSSGSPDLDAVALSAVKASIYRRMQVGGKPVVADYAVRYTFSNADGVRHMVSSAISVGSMPEPKANARPAASTENYNKDVQAGNAAAMQNDMDSTILSYQSALHRAPDACSVRWSKYAIAAASDTKHLLDTKAIPKDRAGAVFDQTRTGFWKTDACNSP